VFGKSSNADCVYYIFAGSVRLTDKNIVVPQGQMIGIIGIFSGEHLRTDTAVCLSDVELGMISKNKILELFYQSPEFGAFLIRMVAQRAALDNSPRAAGAGLATATTGFSRWLQ
jgi:CRP-like cAMP-binding protein